MWWDPILKLKRRYSQVLALPPRDGSYETILCRLSVQVRMGVEAAHIPDSYSGVGIMISTYAMKSLVDWKPISDRIIIARFKTRA